VELKALAYIYCKGSAASLELPNDTVVSSILTLQHTAAIPDFNMPGEMRADA